MSKKVSERNLLVDEKFIGIPYLLGAKSFQACDCVGICLLWLKEQGFDYAYDDGYGKIMKHWYQEKPRRFVDAVLQYGSMITWADVKKYDLLLFFGIDEICKFPTMLGVMINDRHFLTTFGEENGSHVEMLNLVWKSKFWGALRLHKVVEKYGH